VDDAIFVRAEHHMSVGGALSDYVQDRKYRVAQNQYMAFFGSAAMLRLTMEANTIDIFCDGRDHAQK